jgi:threonine dehydratase
MTAAVAVPSAALPTSLACAGCGLRVPDDAPLAFACPGARPGDDVDHVLVRRLAASAGQLPSDAATDNPFVRWRSRFHAYHRARALGWSDDRYRHFVERLDERVCDVDGRGFRITPFVRANALSEALGFATTGGVWVKDETGNVSGSHKARHLFGTLLELTVEEARDAARRGRQRSATERPRLAIASCGNAALAAAVVARAAGRPLDVFVPPGADPVVVDRLRALGANLAVCERQPGVTGDPTYAALLRALDGGAIPFTCQGNLNGLAIEGGATLGWELAAAVGAPDGPPRIDRLIVQVGGGALLSAVVAGLAEGAPTGFPQPRVHAVQPAAVHPLARAFELLRARVAAGEPPAVALGEAARHRGEFMWPWETEPHSVAHGIIDDETYDWRACIEAMLASGGEPIIVAESTLLEANAMARSTTGIDVDPTGSAGLAGLLDLVRSRAIGPAETAVVLFTGAVRRPPAAAPIQSGVAGAGQRGPRSPTAASGGT